MTTFLLFSILCYVSVLMPPTVFWPAVFLSYAIPVVLAMNILLLITLLLLRLKLSIFPLISLLLGLPFVLGSARFGGRQLKTESEANSLLIFTESDAISVLSFNSKFFRKRHTYSEFSYEMIRWVSEDASDVKCIQEYSTNNRWNVLDVTRQIEESGYNGFVYKADMVDDEHSPGMAIFTNHQLLDMGYVWKNFNTVNAGIYADIVVRGDTIRVYNVHLASMHLKLYEYKDTGNYKNKIKRLMVSLKRGAETRSNQIELLIEHSEKSPYPYIICGDFNETPYSYNYFSLKKHFKNTFESVGRGFGFTFNSILFFLRIDHQFYSDGIIPARYRVDRRMKISDHFPTRAVYYIDGSSYLKE